MRVENGKLKIENGKLKKLKMKRGGKDGEKRGKRGD